MSIGFQKTNNSALPASWFVVVGESHLKHPSVAGCFAATACYVAVSIRP